MSRKCLVSEFSLLGRAHARTRSIGMIWESGKDLGTLVRSFEKYSASMSLKYDSSVQNTYRIACNKVNKAVGSL